MSDTHKTLAGELIATIRLNTMRETWKDATTEQVDEWLKPFVERLGSATCEAAELRDQLAAERVLADRLADALSKCNGAMEADAAINAWKEARK